MRWLAAPKNRFPFASHLYSCCIIPIACRPFVVQSLHIVEQLEKVMQACGWAQLLTPQKNQFNDHVLYYFLAQLVKQEMKIDTAFCSVSTMAGAPTSFRILPAGRFCTNDGRPAGIDSFHLDAALAATLVKQAASAMNDYVIDYEHQSLRSAENGQPVRAAGWFKTLEWREGDGLYVTNVRWTAAASEMLKANEYRYISPVFGYSANGDIVRLHSAAVTNVPALDGLTDLAAATRLNDPTAPGQGDFEQQNAVLKAHFGANAALVSSYSRGADGVVGLSNEDASGDSGAAMSEFDRQQVNGTLATLFGKGATLI